MSVIEINPKESNFMGWAFVKYCDGKEEMVQTTDIENFEPLNEKDYVFKHKYVIRSAKWNTAGRIQRNLGYICRMNETLEGLKESISQSRPKYPPLEDTDDNYLSSLSEHERKQSVGSYNAPQKIAALKRKAEENDMSAFLKCALPLQLAASSSNQKFESPSGKMDVTNSSKKKNLGSTRSSIISSNVTQSNVAGPSSNRHSISQEKMSDSRDEVKQDNPKNNGPSPKQPNINIRSNNKSKLQINSGKPSNSKQAGLLKKKKKSMSSFPDFKSLPNFEENCSASHLSSCSTITTIPITTIPKTPTDLTAAASQLDFFRLRCQELEEKNRQMEEELKRKNAVDERLKVIEKKIDKIPTMDMFQNLSSRMTSMEESFKNFTKPDTVSKRSSASEATKSVLSSAPIDLGGSLTCTSSAWDQLMTVGDLNEWCTALLLGVFKDDAKNYSLWPRKNRAGQVLKKAFPDHFKQVAQHLYSQYLERQGHKPPFPKGTVSAILGKLSKKANDLRGRRNKDNKASSSSSQSIPEMEMYILDPESGCLVNPTTGKIVSVDGADVNNVNSDEEENNVNSDEEENNVNSDEGGNNAKSDEESVNNDEVSVHSDSDDVPDYFK